MNESDPNQPPYRQAGAPLPPHKAPPIPELLKPELLEEEPTWMGALSLLLKRPIDFFHTVNEKGGGTKWAARIGLMVFIGLALFGFVLGCFSGGQQLWAVPLKLSGGVFFAGLICFPSLIIFSSLGGVSAKPSQMLLALVAMLGLTMLLLLGFAPVVWLFSVSSNYASFVGCLALLIWIISISFGLRMLFKLLRLSGLTSHGPAQVWAVVFCLVSFQLTTTLRPLLGEYRQFLNLEEKRFFLGYWFEQLGAAPARKAPEVDPFEDADETSTRNRSNF